MCTDGTKCPACISPPPPASSNAYSFSLTLTGTVADYDSAAIDDMKSAIATKAEVDVSKVSISVEAGSVLLSVTIAADSPAASIAIANLIDPFLADATLAAELIGVPASTVEAVTSAPTVSPIMGTSGVPAWAIALIIVVSVIAVVVCGLVCVMMKREKEGKPIFTMVVKPKAGTEMSKTGSAA